MQAASTADEGLSSLDGVAASAFAPWESSMADPV